jgi:hypothetical protein
MQHNVSDHLNWEAFLMIFLHRFLLACLLVLIATLVGCHRQPENSQTSQGIQIGGNTNKIFVPPPEVPAPPLQGQEKPER